ncbi:MAG: hypothetical protein Fur0043_05320 [Anaerolineales bacterium]
MENNRRIFTALLFLCLALLGLLLTRHYGESWDELKFYKYADLSLQAYTAWPTTGQVPQFGNTYDNYGPAYVMLVSLGARSLSHLLPWETSDLRHLLYFCTFLAGIWAFYALAWRWLRPTAALGATALFATQPLFWGHAFISPKDIPFLSFFLLSLLFGLRLFDRPRPLLPPGLAPRSRRLLLVLTALWLASVFGLFLGLDLVHAWLEAAVRAAAAGTPNLISRIASDLHKVAPEVYIQRYFTLFIQARAVFFYLSASVLVYLYRRLSPTTLSSLLAILFPALLLGIATSIRILGPLAGLLVTLYALQVKGRKALPILAVYFGCALAAMYATWPYLWPDPVGHLVESLRVMSQYPWPGQVLFDGVQYASTDIPRAYLPTLLAIQLTEPVWALFLVGLTVAGWGLVKKRENLPRPEAEGARILLALTLVWFVLPLAGFIVARTPLYDNFRQVFFILPPVFWMAGVVFEKVKWRVWLIALAVLPGLVGIVRLHPYEYIYYNAFAGGEKGAFRRFELDYWGISYREAAAWLNENAPPEANVWVEGPAHLLDLYLREDLNLYSTYEAERAGHYEYVVATTRYNLDLESYPHAEIVYRIERGGALLAVIKQP